MLVPSCPPLVAFCRGDAGLEVRAALVHAQRALALRGRLAVCGGCCAGVAGGALLCRSQRSPLPRTDRQAKAELDAHLLSAVDGLDVHLARWGSTRCLDRLAESLEGQRSF